MEWWHIALVGTMVTVVGSLVGIGIWIGSGNTDRKAFREFMAEVRADIKAILNRLPSDTIGGQSPLALTAKGKRVSLQLNVKAWANQLAPSLVDSIKDKKPYDIQEFCFDYVRGNLGLTDKMESQIKDCAYQEGTDREGVLDVLAIQLRDVLIETNK